MTPGRSKGSDAIPPSGSAGSTPATGQLVDLEGRYAVMRAEAAHLIARASFDGNLEPLYTEAQLAVLRDWIATAKGWKKP